MTGTANHIPEPDITREERKRTLISVLLIILSYIGVFAAGGISGYMIFRNESLHRTEMRDKAVQQIQNKLDTLPEQLKAAEKGDPK